MPCCSGNRFTRHFCGQARLEVSLLFSTTAWRFILAGVLMQYIHSVATNLVYYLHVVRPPLKDLGFMLLGRISEEQFWISEALFYPLFISGMGTLFLPLLVQRLPRPFNVTFAVKRTFVVISVCQLLRCLTFPSTVLPGPAGHCQDMNNSNYNPPIVAEIFYRMDASYGCGDLVFSSHFTFAMISGLVVARYVAVTAVTVVAWMLIVALSLLVVASHKHYSVDLVVASYTVPLVWFWWAHMSKDPPVRTFEAVYGGEKVPVTPAGEADDIELCQQ